MDISNEKVLIISHNPLSAVNNNGKTLASIFDGLPEKNIYQIYLNSENPDYSDSITYLQINERQIIESLIKCKNVCCKEVNGNPEQLSATIIKRLNFANHIKRLIREGIWKTSIWKLRLKEWLKDKKFDVVFFMAGDGLFAYDIYRFVIHNTSAKKCLFFTDDYILGASSVSPVALLRRFLLRIKMKNTLNETDELYVISDEMREAYREIFGMDGYVIRNFSVEIINGEISNSCDENDHLKMVYAGGLHYNRWKVLEKIANELKKVNDTNSVKCLLEIYSAQNIPQKILDRLNVEGVSRFMGGATASQIAGIYAASDILVHVESFDKKAIASTKYSFSTKIPEYMSAGKCILAIGPSEVSSMKYLMNCACTITDEKTIFSSLNEIVSNKHYRDIKVSACKNRYEQDFSREKQKECLERILGLS